MIKLGPERLSTEKISQRHMDLAKSVQSIYEDIIQSLNDLYEKYRIKNLTLSGGCAMNSVANGKILKILNLKKFIFLQIQEMLEDQ